jgi:predicted aldo/keto reductase-like oxidoreductase
MHYRPLGKTGLTVSQLGFGAMRLPMKGEGPSSVVDLDLAIPMIHRAFEAGVNYIDTAVMYCNDDSQRAVGEALKGWRDKVVVSTKNHYFGEDEKEWWTLLEQSLDRLQIDSIDIYNHHGVNRESFQKLVLPTMSRWMEKAKDQGLIKHVSCSFHDGNEALCEIVDSGYPAVITLQYNLLDRQLEDGIARAHGKGIGVIVMGPVGGGRLGSANKVLETFIPNVKRIPELALSFVLANPNVDMAISGMGTMEQVEENVATVSNLHKLTEDDKAAIDDQLVRLRQMADLYCTGCGYCMPCPAGVNIPRVFDAYNDARVYGLWDHARRNYAKLMQPNDGKDSHGANACVECGECLPKCPQHIDIPTQLKQSHTGLTKGS